MKGEFMRRLFYLGLLLVGFFALGCARQIVITPALDAFSAGGVAKIDKAVGYHIPPENLAKEVITPAGGGDKVKYLPYKESEPVLSKVLSNIFREVYSVPSLGNAEFMKSKTISFIFIPTIVTDSSSRSAWIWPPSDFTVSLGCKATDASGAVVWETSVKAEATPWPGRRLSRRPFSSCRARSLIPETSDDGEHHSGSRYGGMRAHATVVESRGRFLERA
jgi:hypothetical protein